jgi:hypothetical protein
VERPLPGISRNEICLLGENRFCVVCLIPGTHLLIHGVRREKCCPMALTLKIRHSRVGLLRLGQLWDILRHAGRSGNRTCVVVASFDPLFEEWLGCRSAKAAAASRTSHFQNLRAYCYDRTPSSHGRNCRPGQQNPECRYRAPFHSPSR